MARIFTSLTLQSPSIGIALADTLDDLISSRRIEPQLAMRIMQNFDQSIAAVLADKVKARMNFKVRSRNKQARARRMLMVRRAILTPIAFAMRSGHSSSKTSTLRWTPTSSSMPTGSRLWRVSRRRRLLRRHRLLRSRKNAKRQRRRETNGMSGSNEPRDKWALGTLKRT